MPSVTEIQLNKLRARFPLDSRSPPPHTLSGTQFAQIIGANEREECGCSLFNYISVTEGIKINEQNTESIGIGPLYLQTEFEAISLLLQNVMLGFNQAGYRTL